MSHVSRARLRTGTSGQGLQVMDRASRFRKGVGTSPFEAVNTMGNPFATLGIEWCPRCRMEVDCDTDAVQDGTVYAYRRRCMRCGKVVKSGIYSNVVMLGEPIPGSKLEWVTEPGADRRGRRRG